MKPLGEYRAEVGEGAVWDSVRRSVLWVDVWGRRVIETASDGSDRIFAMPEMAGAVAPCIDGAILVALETQLVLLDRATGRIDSLSCPPGHPATHRFNDAAVDPAGRLIVGTMRKSQLGPEPTGVLYSYDGKTWRELMSGFWTVNGLAFTPDGGTMYVSDSYPSVQTIWACSYDAETGAVGDRRPFATMRNLDGRPDGAILDAEGGYWIAGIGGSAIYRFLPTGQLDQIIPVPVENPTKLCFGGSDLRSVYVTSMQVNLTRPDSAGIAGSLLRMTSGVAGMPSYCFARR